MSFLLLVPLRIVSTLLLTILKLQVLMTLAHTLDVLQVQAPVHEALDASLCLHLLLEVGRKPTVLVEVLSSCSLRSLLSSTFFQFFDDSNRSHGCNSRRILSLSLSFSFFHL